ncbi:hypothetical protein JRO89_XS07G0006800 [Xanthoceras sorbifolium]|uniref:Protein kinase domain-containing protein n=1 Tax=Xanthoceras sorbifolium TaxID=99658 RepID=A0ABQ8HRS0_9ROSI|nr:hypothetical protein JRO89_XS07G0006800 [Xanthoceras sorbifolium]
MSCFSCLSRHPKDIKIDIDHAPQSSCHDSCVSSEIGRYTGKDSGKKAESQGARSFTFRELATATQNFREVNLIGEGGFGKVVAVKQLNHEGLQGHQEFIVEVLMLSLLHNNNLVKLIGYCTAGDQRLLVYEYMPMGSLEDHLYVMGTYGYCAPEYAMSGKLTLKSDIYSLGVVLLELITGRKAMDASKRHGEQNLVAWARQYLKDQKKFFYLADPLLQGRFPRRCLNYAIAITAMCLNEEANFRPLISDIVVALEYLAAQCQSPASQNPGVRSEHSSVPEFSRRSNSRKNSSA